MSKRYIFFIGTLCEGGAERVVSIVASKMAEQGMPVEILTYYDQPRSYEVSNKVKLTAVETLTGNTNKMYNMLQMRKYFKQNALAVVSFLAPFNIIAITANFGSSVPLIVADRNDPSQVPSNSVIRKLRDILYMFATTVVVQTNKNREYFNTIVQKKCKVIYNPVDLKEYAGVSLNTEKSKKIVTAGRLMPQKNQKLMIKAFSEVAKEYPEYQLIIYGEGPLKEELHRLCKDLHIKENVMLAGNVKDLHEKMKDAEIFVLSSDYEGMPNALIEAMCMGLPVISTRVSGATDLIKDHENGLLVDIDDMSGLVHAMTELIEKRELAQKLSKNAVVLNEELELSKIIEQWMKVIPEI